jgi:nucleotide-binding universal stress UspA family protein
MKLAIERICVPTDFSPAADHAVHYAAALASAHGAALHLLHVIEHAGPLVHHPDFTGDGEVARAYFNQLEQAAASADETEPEEAADTAEASDTEDAAEGEASFLVPNLIKSLKSGAVDKIEAVGNQWWSSLEVHRDVRYGNAVKEINHYVERLEIDLVVIGTHGHSKIAKMLLGSVTERLVRICSCPVTVIRHPEHSYKVYPDD